MIYATMKVKYFVAVEGMNVLKKKKKKFGHNYVLNVLQVCSLELGK